MNLTCLKNVSLKPQRIDTYSEAHGSFSEIDCSVNCPLTEELETVMKNLQEKPRPRWVHSRMLPDFQGRSTANLS